VVIRVPAEDDLRTVRRISELLRSRPPAGADGLTRAAWFDQKASVFDAIADEDPNLACEAAEMAQAARDHARRIRGGRER
jgi:hypothetical protein